MTDLVKSDSREVTLKNTSFDRTALLSWTNNIDLNTKPVLKIASIVLIIVFGFGGLWATFAPIGGAVIASGKVIAEGRNREIQHLEGGIIEELNVREGDRVTAGQTLAILDPLQSGAQLESYRLQRAIARIQLARRRAEVHELDEIQFPTDLNTEITNHPRVIEALSSQDEEFKVGQKFRSATNEIIDTRIQGLEGDIQGRKEVLEALNRQLELFELELKDFRVLLEQGHIARTRVFATERKVVELIASIANKKLEIKKAENEILNLRTEKRQKNLEFLQNAHKQLVEIQSNLSSADSSVTRLADMLERTIIKAPVSGTVFQTGKYTIGGVVQPAETLFIIFPDDDALTIEAMLQPTDRDQVHVGQDVQVVFPSDQKNQMKPVPGKLTYVSADTIESEMYPMGTYTVKVKVEPEESPEQLLPGNLAEVYIQTPATTFLKIISEPVTRFAFKAFKG